MSRSKIRVALNLSKKEFEEYTETTKPDLKESLRKVIFDNVPYTKTGHTKQAIYSGMKRLYRKKFGKEFEL